MDNKLTEALKPCPWCDGEVRDNGDGTVFHAGEHHCPIGGHFDKGRWNRRTPAETVSREAINLAMYQAFQDKIDVWNEKVWDEYLGKAIDAIYALQLPAPQPQQTVSREEERAFQVLEMYGVPRDRAVTVATASKSSPHGSARSSPPPSPFRRGRLAGLSRRR